MPTFELSTRQLDAGIEDATQRIVGHARDSFLAFVKFVTPEFRVNWHHRVIGRHLDRFVRGEIPRLMVFLQPQIGKSELVSRHLPAYLFGRDPDHRVIAATYGDSFASLFNLDVQRIMDSERYRMAFPVVRLAEGSDEGRWMRNSSTFDVVGRRGRYHSVGVGGSLTGRTGNTLIIDDFLKNAEEANSALFRDRLFRWYATVARTRLKASALGPPKVLLTMTRWHEDDPAARILAVAKANPSLPQWTVLSFPAVREDMSDPLDPRKVGEPLWPEMCPMSELEEVRATDPRSYYSLYQQRPSPEEGTIVKRNWWRHYREAPECDLYLQSWDLTFKDSKGSDFVCGGVWGRKGANSYLLDIVHDRLSFTDSIHRLQSLSQRWPKAGAKLVEEAANGAALIDTLRNKVPGLIPVRPRGSKENRLRAVAHQIEAGNVHLPDPETCPWVRDFIEEFAVFPNGKHDDRVDMTTQALQRFSEMPAMNWSPVSITAPSKWIR